MISGRILSRQLAVLFILLPMANASPEPEKKPESGAIVRKEIFYYDLENLQVFSACPAGMVRSGNGCDGDPGQFLSSEAKAFCESSGTLEGKSGILTREEFESILKATQKGTEKGTIPDGFYWALDGKGPVTLSIKDGVMQPSPSPDQKARLICRFPWSGDPDWLESRAGERLGLKESYEGWLLAGLKEFNDILALSYVNGGIQPSDFVKRMGPYIEPGPSRDQIALSFYKNYQGIRDSILVGKKYQERWEVEQVVLDLAGGTAMIHWERSVRQSDGSFRGEGNFTDIWKVNGRRWVFSATQP